MTASWALISLTEFIAAVGRPDATPVAIDQAVVSIMETLDAEASAVSTDDHVEFALGFGRRREPPYAHLLEISLSDASEADIDGIGFCHVVRVDVEGTGRHLLFARTTDAFTTDEVAFVRAVGRVLGLTYQTRDVLQRERDRASRDSLTGLPNRSTLESHLDAIIRNVETTPVTVLFVDLDRFKLMNDSMGHSVGDVILTTVSDRLRTAVRDNDVVGRLAGDEFVVICEGISDAGAIELGERIQASIGKPIRRGVAELVLTASVGIAQAQIHDSAEQVIANADLAMYRAKQAGRAKIEVFDNELRAAVIRRLRVDQELRRALEQDELVLYTQPVVALPSREIVSEEVLVRWNHPSTGIIGPGDFIPDAEESGFITAVDRAIVKKSLKYIAGQADPLPVSVNLSGRTFTDQTLVSWLEYALDVHGVRPELLTIEVTETALMENIAAAATQIELIRNLGVAVVIDDFGTGYSSLSHLQTFDVDGVKIDRSFVASLGTDVRSSAIVAAVLHMADALGFVIVAEGVEESAQIDLLLDVHRRTTQHQELAIIARMEQPQNSVALFGQGYLFGRPAPVEVGATMVLKAS
ncbi:MAG: EAL domain-containing protein [Acidimicrobiales bacterium]|nr:EAL domain-containing protein [Acidimicrobiales bacterium]RZV45267.1 MAG: EAL domain-containing protein [Acidimicrobiales bacterium]